MSASDIRGHAGPAPHYLIGALQHKGQKRRRLSSEHQICGVSRGDSSDWPRLSSLAFARNQPRLGRCRHRINRLNEPHAPVAQLDRALPSEGKGHTFESCRVRHCLNLMHQRLIPLMVGSQKLLRTAGHTLVTTEELFQWQRYAFVMTSGRFKSAA